MKAGKPTMTDKKQDHEDAHRQPGVRPQRRAIEAAIKRADQATHPGHRMADCTHQPIRITNGEFDQHGE